MGTTQLPLVSSNPNCPESFPKNSHHNEAYLIPRKRKIMRQEKRKKRGGEKAKRKSQDCCAKFCFLRMPKLRRLFYIVHLGQKAAKCATCKWLYGKFSYSSTVTRKPLDKLQTAFFGKLYRRDFYSNRDGIINW